MEHLSKAVRKNTPLLTISDGITPIIATDNYATPLTSCNGPFSPHFGVCLKREKLLLRGMKSS
jgi:hypothetical protein